MPPADAAPADADRSESSPGRAGTDRPGSAGRTVPPPRPAPAVERAPAAPPQAGASSSGTADLAPDHAGAGLPQAGVPPTDDDPPVTADELTERERRILAFEQQWWKHAGAKEQAIRDTFGLSATRYYQLLNALLDRPAALVAEPVLVGRLRRLRSSRARNRRR